jgi:hypothetical protein
MRQPQVCKHQVCDHCGGRFGMVTHRWWGNKFCKRTCKDAYLREVTLDRDLIRRWFGLPWRRDTFKLLSPLARSFGRNADPIFAKFRRALEPLARSTSPLTGEDCGTTGQIIAIQASNGGIPFYCKPGNKRGLV